MPTAIPIRETPAAEPLLGILSDLNHPDVETISPPEPVLQMDQIQGNIFGGFNKDFQTFLFLTIDRADFFQGWVESQIPFVATSAEVIAFNRLFKSLRHRRNQDTGAIKVTWMNMAFTYAALEKMKVVVPNLLDTDFVDQAFKDGLATRSAELGDETDFLKEGHPANWVVGGTSSAVDVLLLVASDDREGLTAEVTRIEDSLYAFTIANGQRTGSGARIVYKQNGANLPGRLAGHEHFGFLDGVSQPGIRGRLSDSPTDVLTLRQNPNEPNDQGKPGQDLLWPGEFVFGYPGQDAAKSVSEPGDSPKSAGPAWAKNGSLLVFRRLRQDVFGFHQFLQQVTQQHNVPVPSVGSAPAAVGAQLVGRWPSGAPVLRTPSQDRLNLGSDDCANNNFEFQKTTPNIPDPSNPKPAGPLSCTDPFLTSPGDPNGQRCPFSGHIRKVYPRDDIASTAPSSSTSPYALGGPCATAVTQLGEQDTQTHRLLRRGIPFGEASQSTPTAPVADDVDRGLLFLAYQTSLEHQFEFVTKCWVNNPDFKEPGTGFDPILGQNNASGENRLRTFSIQLPDDEGNLRPVSLSTNADWVIPTGGDYFFSPSLDALALLAGRKTVTDF